ncbi:type II toxin-antitoxin system mRNA interferase toxin, RelE/StbE family [Levilactobacillus suantsaiihabitans]|uniref:Type II toxin-antitoxin system mRNA interferase toxin, RelE/StbE family n=1 Tax=Levilactobacillus suantsaiihabitans TaxID=2487722 RepID=A0A4Z0J4N3_9LACO|nr:type II toxin-antitoxin system mRNA interferase toxin, RelE/StbE family [Levilactobacillus suantsaiihabitans]TGD17395.1 type II toxin-antitoxin system mRNA interferase toxin, RelE/StbE family [Levilactobacillus suantsaiihabitans]
MLKSILLYSPNLYSFKRNYKRLKRKHYDMSRLKHVIELLVVGKTNELRTKHKDHKLSGKYHFL